jgi:flagellar hook protein FlgE
MGLSSTTVIALSGMQAAQQRLGSASHNIANSSTDGFKRKLASSQPQEGGGVLVTLSQAAEAGPSLAEDVVAQRIALYEFKANMQTFKAAQEMLGSLLDIRA